MITVALPNYASDIAWLAMESLCRQETYYTWELVVYEDSDLPLGIEFFEKYIPRLRMAGCVEVKYKYSRARVPLNQKWITMAHMASDDSIGLVLQATDCYSEPERIQHSMEELSIGVDHLAHHWRVFYHIPSSRCMVYIHESRGINPSISMRALKQMPIKEEQWSSVDTWLRNNMLDGATIKRAKNSVKGINTDGYNRLSLKRAEMYENPRDPFYPLREPVETFIPTDILRALGEYNNRKGGHL